MECARCGKDKPGAALSVKKGTLGAPVCEYCRMLEKRKISERNYASHIKSTYGLTLDQYDRMLDNQNGVCAICGQPEIMRRLAVDHDHETGKVRGLLCTQCNFKLGILEDEDFVSRATEYLK